MPDHAAPKLPAFTDRIRRTYLRGESSLFLLHHNVFDQVPYDGKLYDVVELLTGLLLDKTKQTIVVYDPSSRVRVVKRGADAVAIDAVAGRRSASEVLPALEELLLTSKSTALIIKYLDMLAPQAEMQFLSEQDRINIVALHRWSLDTRISQRDNVVFGIAEQLSSVHSMVVSNPRVASIELPMPDLEARTEVCRLSDPSLSVQERELLGKHTAGLKAVQIQGLLSPDAPTSLDDERRYAFILGLLSGGPDAEARARKLAGLTRSMSEAEIRHLLEPHAPEVNQEARLGQLSEVLSLVRTKKREIIEKECFGLIELMEPRHDFSAVGGMDEIKRELSSIVRAIKTGDRARVPMGLLFVGPMGTGKTFIAGAFAREAGIPAVKLKNFRSKWVGATESNLEKVLSIVKALGPVMLVIDEGDRSFGDAGDSDGGTSSRVIARIKEFMSDPDNRGQVIFVIMTNRPDKLDVDIKRAGRLDRKIPFFYAGTPDEVEGILEAQFVRHGIPHAIDFGAERARLSALLVDTSNADLEAIVLLANELAHQEGVPLGADVFERAMRDYMPSRDEAMLRYMELLAVFEASKRQLLPPKYRELTNEELDRALREARLSIAGAALGRTP